MARKFCNIRHPDMRKNADASSCMSMTCVTQFVVAELSQNFRANESSPRILYKDLAYCAGQTDLMS